MCSIFIIPVRIQIGKIIDVINISVRNRLSNTVQRCSQFYQKSLEGHHRAFEKRTGKGKNKMWRCDCNCFS